MIARLRGLVIEKTPNLSIVEAGGVGYAVHHSLATFGALPPPGHEAVLRIHTMVREDAIQLYGFATAEEQELFELLLLVKGIGHRLALNALSGIGAGDLAHAIAAGDIRAISRAPGIGKKTAERMVLELKDKVEKLPWAMGGMAAPAPVSRPGGLEGDARSVLANLGFKPAEIDRVLPPVLKRLGSGAELDEVIRACLTELGGKG
ncbi:MAG: Holliday junction ATP-dependent DNA helicase RuvA [Myxococcota bacterium]|nr:Holliday junction ATP-dependent DNA helicase RuvA [Myxococcota bacterium]